MTDAMVAHLRNLPIPPVLDPEGKWMFVRNGRAATTSVCQGGLCKTGLRRRVDKQRWAHAWETMFAPNIENVVVFTFVRNPWDRVCSAFFQCRDRAKTPSNIIDQHWDFRDYVEQVLRVEGPTVNVHFAPQYDTFRYNDEPIPGVFIGLFERLRDDWTELTKLLGVSKELPHLNAGCSNNGSYRNYYDDATAEIVGNMYAKEIAALGYTFGEQNGS